MNRPFVTNAVSDPPASQRHCCRSNWSGGQGKPNLQIGIPPDSLQIQRPHQPDGQAGDRDQCVRCIRHPHLAFAEQSQIDKWLWMTFRLRQESHDRRCSDHKRANGQSAAPAPVLAFADTKNHESDTSGA